MTRRLLIGAATAMAMAANSWAGLTHLYTFNDGTANDSVGAANGTLFGGATVSGGELVLPGGLTNVTVSSADNVGPYASLDAGAIAVNTYSALTLELWLKSAPANTSPDALFTMAAVLGRHTTYTADPVVGNEAPWSGHQYIMLQPTRNNNPAAMRVAITNDRLEAETGVNGSANLADDQLHQMVATVDATNITFYLDGILQGTAPLGTNSLAQLSNEVAYLGRSVYSDPFFAGTIDEFAIYDNALTASEVTARYNTGPDGTGSPGVVTLTIDRDTGSMTLSKMGAPYDMFRYTINSASGTLDPAQWQTIADNADSDNGGSFDNDDVWTIQSSTSFSLSEEELVDGGGDNGGLLGTGGTESLVLSTAGGWVKSYKEDVTMSLGILVNGSEVTTPVSVVYTGNGDQPFARSDFNFDGSINGTDYEILRANQFVTLTETTAVASYAKGDVNGDLRNDVNDFRLFKADYIAANGPGSFAALVGVPEPSTILLALGGLAGIAALRRQR
ncbi:MAG: PEP-CTERM sorting domain-containing protein [Planctomycetales bacterium]|nr:PEP-CTERM sorting domain-containing protein [Planctomycetales bacterium]